MGLCRWILRRLHWSVDITVPHFDHAVVCVAPHTSNLDFPIGWLAWRAVGRRAGFLMKSTWFFPPLGWILRAMGGVPVHRGKRHDGTASKGLVEQIVDLMATRPRLTLAVTPEGTRSANPQWHTGFLRIAMQARVPVVLGVIDFGTRCVTANTVFEPSGDIDTDLARIKQFYRAMGPKGRHEHNFVTD